MNDLYWPIDNCVILSVYCIGSNNFINYFSLIDDVIYSELARTINNHFTAFFSSVTYINGLG